MSDPTTTAARLRQYLTANPADCRLAVMDRMHHDGRYAIASSDDRWEAAYLLGDGFGTVTKSFAVSQCWDWSHVRDSSQAALVNMALALLL